MRSATPGTRTALAGVDMESYELAEALDAAGVPWLALRSVLDPAGSVLPAPVARWTSEADDRGDRDGGADDAARLAGVRSPRARAAIVAAGAAARRVGRRRRDVARR